MKKTNTCECRLGLDWTFCYTKKSAQGERSFSSVFPEVLAVRADRKNKLCNLKIKPVMVLCAFSHGFQAPQLRRFLFTEREGMKVVGWLFQAGLCRSDLGWQSPLSTLSSHSISPKAAFRTPFARVLSLNCLISGMCKLLQPLYSQAKVRPSPPQIV